MWQYFITFFSIGWLALVCSIAQANIFSADIHVLHAGKIFRHQFSFRSMQAALDSFSDDFLKAHFSAYSIHDTAYGTLNLRGLKADFRYDGPSSNNLDYRFTIDIPEANVNHEFFGTNRNQIDQQVEQWFKDSGDSVVTKVYQAMVSKTPFDPVAGNPSSLMASMVTSAFTVGDDIFSGPGEAVNLFNIGATYQQSSQSASTIRSYQVPLGYARVFDQGRYKLLLNSELQYYQYDRSNSFSGEINLALARKMNSAWSVAPIVSIAGVGSPDMGSLSLVWGGFIKSQLQIPIGSIKLQLTNMVGYMQTQDIQLNDVNIDYKLHNWAADNGLAVVYRMKKAQFFIGYDHTSMMGSHWYYSDYDRVKVGVAQLSKIVGTQFTSLSLDASVTFAHPDFRSYAVGLSYQF